MFSARAIYARKKGLCNMVILKQKAQQIFDVVLILIAPLLLLGALATWGIYIYKGFNQVWQLYVGLFLLLISLFFSIGGAVAANKRLEVTEDTKEEKTRYYVWFFVFISILDGLLVSVPLFVILRELSLSLATVIFGVFGVLSFYGMVRPQFLTRVDQLILSPIGSLVKRYQIAYVTVWVLLSVFSGLLAIAIAVIIFDLGSTAIGWIQVQELKNKTEFPGSIVFSAKGYKVRVNDDVATNVFIIKPNAQHKFQLTSSPHEYHPTLSPDGSKIAFVSRVSEDKAQICIMDSSGSNQSVIVNDAYINESPAWCPDGETIAYESKRKGRWKICMVNRKSGENYVYMGKNKQGDDIDYESPAWSPDGKYLAFTANTKNSSKAMVVNVAAGTFACPDIASPTNKRIGQLCFAGASSRLAFTLYEDGKANTNSLINITDINPPDGTWQYNIVETPEVVASCPVFSPDGNKLAYLSYIDKTWMLYVKDITTNVVKRISGYSSRRPCWSLDSSNLYYGCLREGSYELFRYNMASEHESRLTNTSRWFYRPTLSKDGQYILANAKTYNPFSKRYEGEITRLVRESRTEQKCDKLQGEASVFTGASCSPYSSRIAFTGFYDDHDQIFVSNSPTSPGKKVTDGSTGFCNPEWFKQSNNLIIESTGDRSDIYVLHLASTSEVEKLTKGPSDNSDASVSPDDASIVFQSDREGIEDEKGHKLYQLFNMDLKTKNVTRITYDNSSYSYSHPSWSPDGQALVVTKTKWEDEVQKDELHILAIYNNKVIFDRFLCEGSYAVWSSSDSIWFGPSSL